MTTPAITQPTAEEQRTCMCGSICQWWYTSTRRVGYCMASSRDTRPIGCPVAERARVAYNQSLQERRVAVGRPAYSMVCSHRDPIEAEMNENDCQTICFDCEATHQLSCLCFGHDGVPDDCDTYNKRRLVVDGCPTSRYDTHRKLSDGQIELNVGFPMLVEE